MSDDWLFYRGVPIDFPVPEGVIGPIHTIGDSHVNIRVYCSLICSTKV